MGLLDRALHAVTRISRVRANVQSASGGRSLVTPQEIAAALSGQETASGEIVNVETALKIGAVYACVRLIAGAVATLPIEIYRRVDDTHREIADKHPVRALLRRRPNDWQTPSQFKRLMMTWLLLRGNACAQIVWSVGRPIALLPMHPDRVTIRQLPDLSVEYDYVSTNGRQTTFKQEDVFHLMSLSLDGVRGVTPITYARETIGLSIANERYGATMFKNGAQFPGYLSHPEKIGQEGRMNLKESLDDYRAGGASAGKYLILEEGMTADKMAMTAQDAQWIEQRKLSRSDIAMYFGVPPSMIGDNSGSDSNWGTGLEQKAQGFITFTLEDYLTPWEETIERDLLTPAEADIYALFKRGALARGDLAARKGYYVSALQWGWMNPDEVRALEDMNPREDGEGGRYYDPPNTAGDTTKEGGASDNPKDA